MKLIIAILITIFYHTNSLQKQNKSIIGTWKLERYQEYGKRNDELKLEDDDTEFYETKFWKFDSDSIYKLDSQREKIERGVKYIINGDTIKYNYWETKDKYWDFFEIVSIDDEFLKLKTEDKRKVNYYYLSRTKH